MAFGLVSQVSACVRVDSVEQGVKLVRDRVDAELGGERLGAAESAVVEARDAGVGNGLPPG